MVYLFTKPGCKKCTYIKDKFDLKKLGVKVADIAISTGLALLAWFELCTIAETELPILLITDKGEPGSDPAIELTKETITGAIDIRNKLEGI